MSTTRKCLYSNCGRNSADYPEMHLFRCPQNEEKRKLWADSCGLDLWKCPKQWLVCDLHFLPSEINLTSNANSPVRLTKDAVPQHWAQITPAAVYNKEILSSQGVSVKRVKRAVNYDSGDDVGVNYPSDPPFSDEEQVNHSANDTSELNTDDNVSHWNQSSIHTSDLNTEDDEEFVKNDVVEGEDNLESQCALLVANDVEELRNQNSALRDDVNDLKKENDKLQETINLMKKESDGDTILDKLNGLSRQLLLSSLGGKAHLFPDLVAFALELRDISPKAYNLLRSKIEGLPDKALLDKQKPSDSYTALKEAGPKKTSPTNKTLQNYNNNIDNINRAYKPKFAAKRPAKSPKDVSYTTHIKNRAPPKMIPTEDESKDLLSESLASIARDENAGSDEEFLPPSPKRRTPVIINRRNVIVKRGQNQFLSEEDSSEDDQPQKYTVMENETVGLGNVVFTIDDATRRALLGM